MIVEELDSCDSHGSEGVVTSGLAAGGQCDAIGEHLHGGNVSMLTQLSKSPGFPGSTDPQGHSHHYHHKGVLSEHLHECGGLFPHSSVPSSASLAEQDMNVALGGTVRSHHNQGHPSLASRGGFVHPDEPSLVAQRSGQCWERVQPPQCSHHECLSSIEDAVVPFLSKKGNEQILSEGEPDNELKSDRGANHRCEFSKKENERILLEDGPDKELKSNRGTNHRCEFLDLPPEILSMILLCLPTSSLMVCIRVHPALESVIRDQRFLDTHTRHTLSFSRHEGADITFQTVPVSYPALMEFWFYTYDTLVKTDGVLIPTSFSVDAELLPLAMFKLSFLTWLTQALMDDSINHRDVIQGLYPEGIRGSGDRSRHDFMEVHPRHIHCLPKYVIQPLTRLALVFPEFVNQALHPYGIVFRLGKGLQFQLSSVWHSGIPAVLKCGFETKHSFQFISDHRVKSKTILSSLAIFFDKDEWIMWTGGVTTFPCCVWRETWSTTRMSVASSVDCVRSSCAEAISSLDDQREEPSHVANSQSSRHRWFPGLCSNLQSKLREAPCTMLNNLKIELAHHLNQASCDTLGWLLYIRSDNAFVNNENVVSDFLTAPGGLETSPKTLAFYQQFQLLYSLLRHPELETVTSLISQALDSTFRKDVMHYLRDRQTHELLCTKCSVVWFPSSHATITCADRYSSQQILPYEVWPAHLLSQAVIALTQFLALIAVT